MLTSNALARIQSFLPSSIAHLRATMAAGEIYSIPRIGCDAAVTDIESVLGVGDPLHHLAKLEAEAGDHGLSLHIETQQEALALPMGRHYSFKYCIQPRVARSLFRPRLWLGALLRQTSSSTFCQWLSAP